MATEKTFQSELPAMLQALFGNGKTTTTSNSTANTAGLQGVYDAAMKPMDQQLYDNLIASIFGKAAGNVPTLTAALANATGGRTTGNSPLALALNEQNNMASKEAAAAILAQQNRQLELAGNAASGIAQATRSTTGTQQQKPPINPLVMAAGGFLLNQADKRGWMDKLGTNLFGGGESATAMTSPLDIGNFMDQAFMPATAFGSFNDAGSMGFDTMFSPMDFGGGGLDLFNGFDFGGGMDFGSGMADQFTGMFDSAPVDDLWNFGSSFFADGGVVRNRPNMGTPDPRMGSAVFNGSAMSSMPRPMTPMTPSTGLSDGGQQGMGESAPLTVDQENAMAADAAAGYPQRDAMMGMFAKTLAGMVLSGLAPAATAVTNLTGLTKSPMGLMTSMVRSGISQDSGVRATPVASSNIVATDLGQLGGEGLGGGIDAIGMDAGLSATGAPGGFGMTDAGNFGFDSGFMDGGIVKSKKGPATAIPPNTSKGRDTVPAKSTVPGGGTVNFQPGEMVIPVDVVNSMGQQFFQKLIDAYHKPIRR